MCQQDLEIMRCKLAIAKTAHAGSLNHQVIIMRYANLLLKRKHFTDYPPGKARGRTVITCCCGWSQNTSLSEQKQRTDIQPGVVMIYATFAFLRY